MKERGQTLIEVLVGLAALLVIIAAVTNAVIAALHNADYEKSQSVASGYTQQGSEIMRTMRDNNFVTFSGLSGTYCLASSCTALQTSGSTCGPKVGASDCLNNVGTIYDREVTIQKDTATCGVGLWQVTVTTSWIDSKCQGTANCEKVSLVSCLSDANLIQSP